MIWVLWIFSFYVVFHISTTTTTATTTTSTINPVLPVTTIADDSKVVSLNGSIFSTIEIDTLLYLNQSFSLEIKTCRGTSGLLKQSGSTGDRFELKLMEQDVVLSYSVGSKAAEVTVATGLKLQTWHWLHWNFTDEGIEFYTEDDSSFYSKIGLNSTVENDIRNIDLSNGSELTVGENFIGCLRSGEQILLSSFSTGSPCFIDHDVCPGDKKCDTFKCWNGGTCVEMTPPQCICSTGYSGTYCEEKMNDSCSSCQNGAACTQLEGEGFTCTCPKEIIDHTNFTESASIYEVGYEGEFCEKWIDACGFNPPICIEGACQYDSKRPYGFKCFCPQGNDFRVGEYCQYKTDICTVGSKCLHGGSCNSSGGEKFICACIPGYTGKRCEIDVDDCSPNPCMYDGMCTDLVNSFNCSCVEGTVGINCETNIDDCQPDPCLNGGACQDQVNRFDCNCNNTGYEGLLCNQEIDECLSSPCQNNGTCTDLVKGYNCTCYAGYLGTECEIDIDECLSNPCQNDGTCFQNNFLNPDYSTSAGYHCECTPWSTGLNCEFDFDDCTNVSCHNGFCKDLTNAYECTCNNGYTGDDCSEKIMPCTRDTCSKNSDCLDFFPDFFCACKNETLFGGERCTIRLTGCNGVKCGEGFKCIPFYNEATDEQGHRCECPPGFLGSDCENDTSFTFNENSSLVLLSKEFSSSSFKFRTTLPLFHLVTFVAEYFILSLSVLDRHCIRLNYYTLNNSTNSTMVSNAMCSKLNFKSSDWIQIEVQWSGSFFNAFFHHVGCHNRLCQVSQKINTSSVTFPGYLHFGKVQTTFHSSHSLSSVISELQPNIFLGCLSYLKLNESYVEDGDEIVISEINKGCNKIQQCDEACHNGACVDMWDHFICECTRPFYGINCSKTMEPATFGYNFKPSAIVFDLSSTFTNNIITQVEITLTFRTKSKNGFLFLTQIDDDDNDSIQNDTIRFIRCEIVDGSLVLQYKLKQNMTETVFMNIFNKYIDGEKHFMNISYDFMTLSVTVDESNIFKENIEISESSFPKLSRVYVGGLKVDQRVKRSLSNDYQSTQNFVGTLQDLRQNGIVLDLKCGGSDFNFAKVTTDECQNVMPGEVTSDICSFQNPCAEGSTCVDVFYNDYKCLCTNNLNGRNCEEHGSCLHHQCPDGFSCQDFTGGYECRATVTLKGHATFVMDMKDDALNSTNMTIKSFFTNARLLRLNNLNATQTCVVSVNQLNGHVLLLFNDEPIQTLKVNQHAMEWLEINLRISSDGLSFISGSTNISKTSNFSCLLTPNLLEVTIGQQVGFEGCLLEARVNNILLPFFNDSNLTEVTSFHKRFLKVQIDNFTLENCPANDNCASNPCKNNGTCQRRSGNDYNCMCSDGYTGLHCEICNLKECTKQCLDSSCTSPCGENCESSEVLSREHLIGILAGTIGGALLLVLVIVILFFIIKVRTKRAKEGVYNPAMEETTGTSVQFNDTLKIPPEERLI